MMIRAIHAELVRLARPRLWAVAGLVTTIYAVGSTVLSVTTAEPARQVPAGGLSVEELTAAGGGTAAVTWAAGFGSILIIATFVAAMAGELSRGTFRAALLHHPHRLSLLAGKFLALLAMVAALLAWAMVVGWVTARLVAPGQDISTARWTGLDALGAAVGDYASVLAWAAGWALFATVVAILARSVPIGLAIGIVWAGPVENIIGDDVTVAWSYFPGLLLQVIRGIDPNEVGRGRAGVTLALYAVAAVVAIGLVLTRRDVTT